MTKQNSLYYLIELHGSALWVRIVTLKNGTRNEGSIAWTNDSREALRFSRRQDAEAFCFLHNEVAFLSVITEHLDVKLPEPPHDRK
jgi:hypothetical protein